MLPKMFYSVHLKPAQLSSQQRRAERHAVAQATKLWLNPELHERTNSAIYVIMVLD